jgi:Ca2+-binding EF-hand superfamily protein
MKKRTLASSAAGLALLGAIGTATAVAQEHPDGDRMEMAKGMGADRTMTWAEFKAQADEGFARLDVNHDSVIDRSDREAMREQMRNRQQSESPHGPDGPPPPPPGNLGPGGMGPGGMVPGGDHPDAPPPIPRPGRGMGGGMGGMGAMMMMRGADTDHDGKITRAEYDAAIKIHFDAMDTNHDGQISKDERQAARAKMRAEMETRMRERSGEMGGDKNGMHHGPGPEGDDMPPPPQ